MSATSPNDHFSCAAARAPPSQTNPASPAIKSSPLSSPALLLSIEHWPCIKNYWHALINWTQRLSAAATGQRRRASWASLLCRTQPQPLAVLATTKVGGCTTNRTDQRANGHRFRLWLRFTTSSPSSSLRINDWHRPGARPGSRVCSALARVRTARWPTVHRQVTG